MDLTFTESETAFRDELRAWFAANPPGERARTARTRTTPGGATSSAGWRRTAWRRCTGRPSTAAAARR